MTRLDEPLRTQLATNSNISEAWDEQWQSRDEQLRAIVVSKNDFVGFIAEKFQRGLIPLASAESIQIHDLWIAMACTYADPKALQIIEERVFARLPGALRRTGKGESDIEDELQTLREKLFVGAPGRAPKIGEYHGLGRLFSWVRISAIRASQNQTRKHHREVRVEGDELWEQLLPAGDSQLEFLKERYQDSFRQALAGAVGSLSDRDRLLLRQHFVEGVPSGMLATLYQVHRATVSRWIVLAQESLLAATRARLLDDLEVSHEELESVLRLIQSQFETGITDLLVG